MTVVSVEYATYQCKKAMKIGLSLFRRRFNSSKCKTMAKMAVARVKLLRNKREVVIRQMRRDIAILLEKKQDATARVRVEHVIREQNIMAANEFVELFCELLVARLQIIAKQRDCPPDLKEGISSLIFAGPRCSEIPELLGIRDVFEKYYGKDFVSAAVDLRPNAGVNRTLIEKLSVRTPSGEVKLKVLKEIAKEYQVDWDTTESEAELLKPPEERIEGPSAFRSASTLPVRGSQHQPVTPENLTMHSAPVEERNVYGFQDSASAAEAAKKSAKEAIAAAEAAAYLAGKEAPSTGFHRGVSNVQKSLKRRNSLNINPSNDGLFTADYLDDDDARKMINRRHSYNVPSTHSGIKFDDSDGDEEAEMEEDEEEEEPAYNRRHSYNNATPPPAVVQSGIKFDESDVDEEIEMERPPPPPKRYAPQPPPLMQVKKQESFSRVHPKLPDYDTLAARFEALKYRKS